MHQQRKQTCLILCIVLSIVLIVYTTLIDAEVRRLGSSSHRRLSCAAELGGANRTFSDWSMKVRQMISETALQGASKEHILREENKLHQLMADFGGHLNRRPIERLVKDLVAIRRQSNRLALDVYLKTYDARWPQNSVQLGVVVERVQQACLSTLDRAAMMVLNNTKEINTYLSQHQEKGGRQLM